MLIELGRDLRSSFEDLPSPVFQLHVITNVIHLVFHRLPTPSMHTLPLYAATCSMFLWFSTKEYSIKTMVLIGRIIKVKGNTSLFDPLTLDAFEDVVFHS